MHGNSKTRPRGIEMEEFLRSRMRRLKKANLDIIVPFSLTRLSSNGEEESILGTPFVSRFMIPMMADCVYDDAQRRTRRINQKGGAAQFRKAQDAFELLPRTSLSLDRQWRGSKRVTGQWVRLGDRRRSRNAQTADGR